MLRAMKIWTLSMLLSSALLSGCGTTRALSPQAAQIPVAERLRADCQGMAAPTAETMLPAADAEQARQYLSARGLNPVSDATLELMATFARFVQGNERAHWGEREATHARIEVQGCLERHELIGLIDASNTANRAAADE